jgi:hypothetical protein
MTVAWKIRGCTLNIFQSGLFDYYKWFLLIYSTGFRWILAILGDIGPFFRPDLGEKLGGCYPIFAYINHRFLNPWRRFKTGNAEIIISQSHFYAGNPLRRAPLWAISGSSGHPFLVTSFFWVLEIW